MKTTHVPKGSVSQRSAKPAPTDVRRSAQRDTHDLGVTRRRNNPASDVPKLGARSLENASFWRRSAAHVIDVAILNVAVIASCFVFIVGARFLGAVESSLFRIVGGVIGAILPLGYCAWFWNKTGATPGKTALGLRVVTAEGGNPTTAQSFIRYFGYLPSGLVFGLGYLWMLWDDEGRCWHDVMAGTRVVRVGSHPPGQKLG